MILDLHRYINNAKPFKGASGGAGGGGTAAATASGGLTRERKNELRSAFAQGTEAQAGAAVEEAARAAAVGREGSVFGSDRVFISDALAELGLTNNGSFATQRLLELNRRRAITLSRADLAYTFTDQAKVRASEMSFLNSTFHFIRLPTPLTGNLRRASNRL